MNARLDTNVSIINQWVTKEVVENFRTWKVYCFFNKTVTIHSPFSTRRKTSGMPFFTKQIRRLSSPYC